MLVTPEIDRRNRHSAWILAALIGLGVCGSGVWTGFLASTLAGLFLGFVTFQIMRRKCRRRLLVTSRPFSPVHEAILNTRVAYYQALTESDKERFRKLVQIFLDEVRITGVRTELDETIRILVAASAIIPIFGFHDWDYHRLSEVLVYPDRFNQEYQSEGSADRNILGLTGLGHLSGVLILSRPALLAGFSTAADKQNVGVHEFAHLMEQEEVSHGLPSEVPLEIVREWVAFVGRELAHPEVNRAHINQYGYTNEHEYLAVLAEYFFKSPTTLQKRDPVLYGMLRELFHQDPAALLSHLKPAGHIGRNAVCPCGSGKKFKDCCRLALSRSNPTS